MARGRDMPCGAIKPHVRRVITDKKKLPRTIVRGSADLISVKLL